MTGIKTGSNGSTRERASQVLIEHKTLQKEWGRAFWPSVHWSLTLPVAFIPLWPSLPALDPAVVVSIATPSCQFCAIIPPSVPELLELQCLLGVRDLLCWCSSVKLCKFCTCEVFAEGLNDFCGRGGICQPCGVSAVGQGHSGLRTLRPFGDCSAARRASFVQPLECQLHIALS